MQESFYDYLRQKSMGVENPDKPKSFYDHLNMKRAEMTMPYVEQGIKDIGGAAKDLLKPVTTLAEMVATAPKPQPAEPGSFHEHLQQAEKPKEPETFMPFHSTFDPGEQATIPPPTQPSMPTMGPMTPELEKKQQEFMAAPTQAQKRPEGVVYGEGGIWTSSPTAYHIGEKVAERAPMYLISPIAGLMFEGITQAKNIIVPLAEKSKYDPTAQRMLAELLPEDTPDWLRTGLTVGEMGADMLIAGFGLRKAAEAPGKVLKDTFKHIYKKAKAKGYTDEQLSEVKKLADKYIRPGTLKEEVTRNIKARRGDVKSPKAKQLGEKPSKWDTDRPPKPQEIAEQAKIRQQAMEMTAEEMAGKGGVGTRQVEPTPATTDIPAKGGEPWRVTKKKYIEDINKSAQENSMFMDYIEEEVMVKKRPEAEVAKELGVSRRQVIEATREIQGGGESEMADIDTYTPEYTHEQAVRTAIERGESVPKEVLVDYPDLVGKPKTTGKPTEPTPAPKVEPEIKYVSEPTAKLVNPKKQKQWLFDKVDKAIEQAPDLDSSTWSGKKLPVEKDYVARRFEQEGVTAPEVVKFEVPGDGVFEVINNKANLELFRKKISKWPVQPLKVKKPSMPSMKRQPVSAKTLEEIKYEKEFGIKYEKPADWRKVTEHDSLVDSYYQDTVADLKKQKKGGFIRVSPKDKKVKFSDKQIEKAVSTSRFPTNEVGAIKQKGVRIKESAKKVFQYEPTLTKYPQFRNDVRLFQDVPWDAFLDAQKKTLATVGKLNKAEYKTFEQYVALKSFEARLNEELAVPMDLTLSQVSKALTEIEPALTPKLREAVQRHLDIVELERQDLVTREKIDSEVGVDFYFPHQVIEYTPIWSSWRGMPKKFKQPFREYLVKRKGSKKPIEVNYINAMTDHYTKVFMDNAIDEFMEKSVKEWDIVDTLSKEDKKLYFGKDGQPKPGVVYEISGKKYRGFQYIKGRVMYPAKTINENLFQRAVVEGLSVAEFAEMEGPKGGKPIKDALALGKRYKVNVLPAEIAERLENFRSPSGDLPGFWAMRDFMSWWKRMTLDFAGLPFQMQNFFGDSLNLYKTDPAAYLKEAEATQIMLKQAYKPERLTSEQQKLLKSAQEQRVTTTHMFRETGLGGLESRKLKQLRSGTWNPINWIGEVFYQIEKASMTREGINRLAKYMKDLERIEKGGIVFSGEIDIKGIEPLAAAGKVAREFTVDYGAVSPAYKKFLRGVLAPFLTFYDYNARNWFKYFKKHPVKSVIKFGVPTVAVWAWNNTGERKEIEENLGFWRHLPHVITGYKTKDGKPIVIALQTPFDMAVSVMGLDRIPDKITRIRAGELTWGEAALEQLKDTGLGGARTAYRLLNPFIQGFIGIATNKDPYTQRPVVPSRFQGTKYEKDYIGEYVVSKILTPYAQYMRIATELEHTPEMGKIGAWLLKGPVDYLRAFGIRHVDIDMNKMIEGYEKKEELTAEVQNKLAIAEKAFIKAALMSDEKEALEYLQSTWKKLGKMEGPDPTNEQLLNRLYHNRTQTEIMTKLIQQTKDPALREEMKQYLTTLKRQKYTESMGKDSIKAIRPHLFKSLEEIHK